MLILARRIGESIMVGDQVEISVVDIKGDQVKLGIKAPSEVKVYRREVYAAIQEENRAAAAAAPESLPTFDELLRGRAREESSEPPKPRPAHDPAAPGDEPGATGPVKGNRPAR